MLHVVFLQLGCYNFCLPAIRYREACANIFTKWLKTPLPPDGGPIVQMTILREPRAHVLSQVRCELLCDMFILWWSLVNCMLLVFLHQAWLATCSGCPIRHSSCVVFVRYIYLKGVCDEEVLKVALLFTLQYFQVATAGDAKFRKFEEEYNELRQESHLPTFPYPPQQASEGGIDKYDTFELWLDMFLDSPTNPTQPNQTLSNREASLVDYTPINMQAYVLQPSALSF